MKSILLAATTFSFCCPVWAELLVYEPFDYTPNEILTGKGGALGTVGTWSSHDTITGDGKTQDWFVHAEGTTSGVGLSDANPSAEPLGLHRWDGTVEGLPTLGGYAGLWGADDWNDDDPHNGEPGRNLDANIALDPSVTATFESGTTTWFSYVAVRGWDRNEETPSVMLCSDPTPEESRGASLMESGSGIGTGGGPPRLNRGHIYPMYFLDGAPHNLLGMIAGWQDDTFTVPEDGRMDWQELDEDDFFGAVNIVVGKIEWDADAGGEDILSVARFLQSDELSEETFDSFIDDLPNLSSVNWEENKPDLDQSTFDTLNIAGLKFFIDELRVGTSFGDVIGVGGPGPVPLAISNIRPDGAEIELTFTTPKPNWVHTVQRTSQLDATDWVEEAVTLTEIGKNTFTTRIARQEEPQQFLRIASSPPPALFEENFEAEPENWIVAAGDNDSGNTTWELGAPAEAIGTQSGQKVYGTNLEAPYGSLAAVTLQSPVITLPDTGRVALEFWYRIDTPQDLEGGRVLVLDPEGTPIDGAQLGPIISGTNAEWTRFRQSLPQGLLGQGIRIGFQFLSDGADADNGLGWFIDDVVVD